MPTEWLALMAWVGLLAVLVAVAVVIGRLAARLFLRATDARAQRR